MDSNVIAVLPPTAAAMLILVARQTNLTPDIKEAKTLVQEIEVHPRLLKGAYKLQQEFPITIKVTSTSIKHTGYLKKDFTCEGGNLSPQFTFIGTPSGAESLAVVVDDMMLRNGLLPAGCYEEYLLMTLTLKVAIRSWNLPVGALEGTKVGALGGKVHVRRTG